MTQRHSVIWWQPWTPGCPGPRQARGIIMSRRGLGGTLLVPWEEQSAPLQLKGGWLETELGIRAHAPPPLHTNSDQHTSDKAACQAGGSRQLRKPLHPTCGAHRAKEAAAGHPWASEPCQALQASLDYRLIQVPSHPPSQSSWSGPLSHSSPSPGNRNPCSWQG